MYKKKIWNLSWKLFELQNCFKRIDHLTNLWNKLNMKNIGSKSNNMSELMVNIAILGLRLEIPTKASHAKNLIKTFKLAKISQALHFGWEISKSSKMRASRPILIILRSSLVQSSTLLLKKSKIKNLKLATHACRDRKIVLESILP